MKRRVRGVILGAMLHGSAHAAVQSTPADPSPGKGQQKVAVVQNGVATGKKNKVARSEKKIEPAAKPVEAEKPDSPQQDGAMESPSDSTEQPIELRGLRG